MTILSIKNFFCPLIAFTLSNEVCRRALALTLALALTTALGSAQVRDYNFEFDGVISQGFPGYGYEQGLDIIIQEDGKILNFGLARESGSFGDKAIAVARYTADGDLDPTFGDGGLKAIRYNNSIDSYYSSSLLFSDQKFLITGQYGQNPFMQKFLPDGSLDTTFGDEGTVAFEFPAGAYWDQYLARRLNDDRFYLIRRTDTGAGASNPIVYELSRYSSDGELDLSFGTDGIQPLDIPLDGEYLFRNFELLDDNSFIMTGTRTTEVEFDDPIVEFAMMHVNADGSIDTDFGIDGIVINPSAATNDAKIQEDGKIVCVGTVGVNELGTSGYMSILRFNPDGTLDNTFSDDGSTIFIIDTYADYAKSVLIQPDGKILIGGSYFNFGGGSGYDCAFVRLLPDGTPDPDFGDEGFWGLTAASGLDQVEDMYMYDEDRVVFGGYGNSFSFNMLTGRIYVDGLATSGDQAICPGGNVTLTAYTDDALIGWEWVDEPGVIFSDQLSVSVSPPYSTDYNVYTANDTATVHVEVLAPPVVNLPADTTGCIGETITVDVSIEYPFFYYWSDNTFDAIKDITAAGQYVVEVGNQCFSTYDTMNVAFVEPPMINLGPDTSLCSISSLLLGDDIPGQQYSWQDGSQEPIFEATTSGWYWVDVSTACGTIRDSIHVEFSFPPMIDLGPDTLLCNISSFLLGDEIPVQEYSWQDGSEGTFYEATSSGWYWVDASTACGTIRDSIHIDFSVSPFVDLGPDLNLCDGDPLTLDATTEIQEQTYQWIDGTNGPELDVNISGLYWVEATTLCGSVRDSINVDFTPLPDLNLGEDLELCNGEVYVLETGIENGIHLWQDGSEASSFEVTAPGDYFVSVTANNCSATDTISINYSPLSINEFSITECDSYTSPSGLYTWTESGLYTDTLSTLQGCDSILIIDLNIPVFDLSINTDDMGTWWVAELEGASYQWYTCNPDTTLIEGETSNSIYLPESGSYLITVSVEQCSANSECFTNFFISTDDLNQSSFSLFPNPAEDHVRIGGLEGSTAIRVYDLNGKVVLVHSASQSSVLLDISDLSNGVYVVEVVSESGVIVTERLVVR